MFKRKKIGINMEELCIGIQTSKKPLKCSCCGNIILPKSGNGVLTTDHVSSGWYTDFYEPESFIDYKLNTHLIKHFIGCYHCFPTRKIFYDFVVSRANHLPKKLKKYRFKNFKINNTFGYK